MLRAHAFALLVVGVTGCASTGESFEPADATARLAADLVVVMLVAAEQPGFGAKPPLLNDYDERFPKPLEPDKAPDFGLGGDVYAIRAYDQNFRVIVMPWNVQLKCLSPVGSQAVSDALSRLLTVSPVASTPTVDFLLTLRSKTDGAAMGTLAIQDGSVTYWPRNIEAQKSSQ